MYLNQPTWNCAEIVIQMLKVLALKVIFKRKYENIVTVVRSCVGRYFRLPCRLVKVLNVRKAKQRIVKTVRQFSRLKASLAARTSRYISSCCFPSEETIPLKTKHNRAFISFERYSWTLQVRLNVWTYSYNVDNLFPIHQNMLNKRCLTRALINKR